VLWILGALVYNYQRCLTVYGFFICSGQNVNSLAKST
jgi:hypothetical protein